MAKLRTVSICLTDLIAHCKAGHTAFTKAQNDKIYVNLAIWDKDEPDQYNKNVSVQLSPTKEAYEQKADKREYVGSGNIYEKKDPVGNSPSNPLLGPDDDDLPF